MPKYVPKNYICTDCGREQYTKSKCHGCNGESFVNTHSKEEKELRQKLHNTIDVMSLSQLKALNESLFG